MFEKFRKRKKQEVEELNVDEVQEDSKIEEVQDEIEVEKLKIEAENMDEADVQKHEKHYSDEGLWKKIRKFSGKAGSTVVYAVLLLYYTLQKPDIPVKVKGTILGALGYFILPIDLIPDLAMGVGYVDDLSVVIFALVQAAMYIDEDVKGQAKEKLVNWFGENVDTSEIDDRLADES